MTKAELLEAAKLRVRKTATDGLDDDVKRLIDTALEDLGRIGVHSSWLTVPSDPLIVEAVLAYVKANYSISDNYETLSSVYDMVLTKIKCASKYLGEAPEPEPEPEPDPDDGDPDDGDPDNPDSGDPTGDNTGDNTGDPSDPTAGTDPAGDPTGDPSDPTAGTDPAGDPTGGD